MAEPIVKVPDFHPAVAAGMREDIAAWKTDKGSGDTDMEFTSWLRATRPQRYQVYLKLTGAGK